MKNKNRKAIKITTNYYQQFDADLSLDVPGEGYGGWKRADIEIAPEHTALVVMHAWDCGTPQQRPGWYRACEYIPRANEICRTVFPPLLEAVRASELKVLHVVDAIRRSEQHPGYRKAVALTQSSAASTEYIETDPILDSLREFRREHVFVGKHNEADIQRGVECLDFPAEAKPLDDEGIAENSDQLFALCKDAGVNHLIYIGFAINWCILLSPGGMWDMSRRGLLCSAIREAVTAVENKETARNQLCKEIALWRVALAFGFVFDLDDFYAALQSHSD